MPSSKFKEYDAQEVDFFEEEDLFAIDCDENGNPYINPDLHNLGMDHEKIEWVDSAMDDIVNLYQVIIDYRDNSSNSHFLEKITFNHFLQFVAQRSYKSV